jgi:FeS assembly SUF system protein
MPICILWDGAIHRYAAVEWFCRHDQADETLCLGIQNKTGSKAMSEQAENITQKSSDTAIPDLKDKVIAAMKTVYDPEIPVDVFELGLIYEINVFPVNNVYVLMTLTSPSCPSAEVIPGEVEQKIKAIEGVQDVKVELTFDPPYSQDMMSEAAKLELGFM